MLRDQSWCALKPLIPAAAVPHNLPDCLLCPAARKAHQPSALTPAVLMPQLLEERGGGLLTGRSWPLCTVTAGG